MGRGVVCWGGLGFGWYSIPYGYGAGVKGNGPVIVFFGGGGRGGTSQLKVTMAWIIVLMVIVGS